MNAYANKEKKGKGYAASNISSQKQDTYGSPFHFADNRPEARAQQGYQIMADTSRQVSQLKMYQEMANNLQPQSRDQRQAAQNNSPVQQSVIQQKSEDIQSTKVAQLVLDQQDLDLWWNEPEEDWPDFDDGEKEQLGKYRAKKLKDKSLDEATKAALASIKGSGTYKSFTYDGETYHLNFKYGTNHVTWESTSRMHYFFKGSGEDISDEQPERGERGQHAYVFSELPPNVQTFIKTYYLRLF